MALLLLTLALTLVLLWVGPRRELGYRVVQIGCAAQLVLVSLVLRHLRRPDGRRADPEAIARRTRAEVEARREKDRLHEVRATVAGISATHRLLRDRRERLSSPTRTRLERLYDDEIGRLERLLDVDRLPGRDRVALQDAVDPVVDSLRLRGQRVAWDGTDAWVVGRSDDIAQIVHILLDNAARHARGAAVSMEVSGRASQVLMRVSDDGPGVPEALVPHLFERGVRGPRSSGQGIGLHIARRLAREMGGDLVVESHLGTSGTTFTVILEGVSEPASLLALRQ